MMTELARTPDTIAAEINGIKESARKTMTSIAAGAAVEIGKRLKEAKSIVPYGGWAEWLQTNVEYSERTAQNLMKIADESNKESFAALMDLGYTQALQLIGLPAADRADFMAENEVGDMSTRELQDRIKEYQEKNAAQQTVIDGLQERLAAPHEAADPETSQEAEALQARLDDERKAREQAEAAKKAAEDAAKAAKTKAAAAEKQAATAKKVQQRLEAELAEERKKSEAQTEIGEPQAPAELPEDVKKQLAELEALREQERLRKAAEVEAAAAMKREGAEYAFRAHFEQFSADYQKMQKALDEMNAEAKARYSKALEKALDVMMKQVAPNE